MVEEIQLLSLRNLKIIQLYRRLWTCGLEKKTVFIHFDESDACEKVEILQAQF